MASFYGDNSARAELRGRVDVLKHQLDRINEDSESALLRVKQCEADAKLTTKLILEYQAILDTMAPPISDLPEDLRRESANAIIG